MDKPDLKPINLNVTLGTIWIAQDRRKAYDKAAKEANQPLSRWARELLDKAAGYKPKE